MINLSVAFTVSVHAIKLKARAILHTKHCMYVCVYSMTNFQEDKSRRRLDDCEEDKNNKEQQDR